MAFNCTCKKEFCLSGIQVDAKVQLAQAGGRLETRISSDKQLPFMNALKNMASGCSREARRQAQTLAMGGNVNTQCGLSLILAYIPNLE